MWYSLMLEYLVHSPYGEKYGYRRFEDMIVHFRHRQQLELRIIRDIIGEKAVILPAKKWKMEEIFVTNPPRNGYKEHHVEPSKASRLPSVLMVMSIALLIVYFMIVIVSLPIGSGAHVLHIPISEIGYYLHRWLCWVAALQLGIFTAANLLRFRGYKLHKAIYGLTLTSAALASGFLRILGNLATVEAFYEMLAKMLVCVVLEGILCSLLSCYIVKKMMQ